MTAEPTPPTSCRPLPALPGEEFRTTRWTQVRRAKADSLEGRRALAELCNAYYEPVVAFLRCELRDADAARELAHDFFAHLLAGGAIARAEQACGRFRSYLLGAVKHFFLHHREARGRLKRGGGLENISLNETEVRSVPDAGVLSPDAVFDRQWALTVNEVKRLEGVDELVQRIQSVPEAGPLTKDIKKIFNAAFFFDSLTNKSHLLPHQAVQPGDAWSSHHEHPVTGWGVEVWDFNVVFQNWEMHENRRCARLDVLGTMKVKSDPNYKRDEATYHPRNGIAEGVVWFDPELGQTIESDIKQDLNVDKKPSLNPGGAPDAAEQGQTITTQRHQVYSIKLEL